MTEKKEEKKKNLKQLNERYTQRMGLVKLGHDAVYKKDYLRAIKYYNNYLKVLADVKDTEPTEISPRHFDPKKDQAEMLLISHVYWEQCKILDRTEKLYSEFDKVMKKFVEFSVNQNYQVVNSEMIRKYIRSGKMVHKKEFGEAYRKLYVTTNKCYIATYCFGEDHVHTQRLRGFKLLLLQHSFGEFLVERYYRYSPHLVDFCSKHPSGAFLVRWSFYPFLCLISYLFSLFTKRGLSD